MPASILAVEDESAILDMIRFALERHGHKDQDQIDIALVDWMLPGGSGLELIRWLRKQDALRQLPVIMLTARTEEYDITSGLDAGADDYVTKPFSPRELHSRINALLRRSNLHSAEAQVQRGPLILDRAAHRVSVEGETIALGHTEYKLLSFLMQNPDRVFSRSQLLDNVWGPGTYIEERTVDVHILRLRKSLNPFAADYLIETVRGAGYRMLAEGPS